MTLARGAHLGPYEIVAPLGAGGMGEVYRARDARLERFVAIKVLPAGVSNDPAALARFEREARAVAALSHPGILSIFDFGSAEGIAYAVTELLEGETLRDRLEAGPIPPRKGIQYAVQTAVGLAAAHDRGIVHRDLKPENLFITRDDRVKILDFGLARQAVPTSEDSATLSRATDPGTVLGTIGYMSPEQVRGKPADQRFDLFSLGTVLYEMVTGQRAFKGETSADTMTAILTKETPEISTSNATLSTALDRIVRRCLEKDPEARFRSAHDLAFALETLSGLSSVRSPAAGIEDTATRRDVARSLLALGVAALIAGAFVLGGRLQKTPLPSFRQLTFRRGTVSSARFTPDGQSIVYAAAWGGDPPQVFVTRPDTVESGSLGPPNTTLVATGPGEMAILVHTIHPFQGTLARIPITGGAPRAVAEYVWDADWRPDSSEFAVVHWSTGKARLEFPVGHVLYEGGPGGILNPRISPRGDQVAFIDSGSSASIVVVDRSGKSRVLSTGWANPSSWGGAVGLAWSPDGREVWFTASKDGVGRDLQAVTLSGKERLVVRMPGTLTLRDISGDNRVLLTHARLRGEAWGLLPGQERERDFSWLDETTVADLSGDGKAFAFLDRGSVYLRRSDGPAPVRLCEGANAALSPDGAWVATISYPSGSPSQLKLVPTGAGEPRILPPGTVQELGGVWWFPDGKRVLLSGRERGKGQRLFVQSTDQGEPRSFTPEGMWTHTATNPISPDGTLVTVFGEGVGWRWSLRATDGTDQTHPIPGPRLPDTVDVLRWSGDGRYLFVREVAPGRPVRIERLEVKTGRREPWRELRPLDPAGVDTFGVLPFMTADGKSYLYSYWRDLSELYLVEGLR